MRTRIPLKPYFPFELHIHRSAWHQLALQSLLKLCSPGVATPPQDVFRHVADRMNRLAPHPDRQVRAGELALFALLNRIFRHLLHEYLEIQHPLLEQQTFQTCKLDLYDGLLAASIERFADHYPGAPLLHGYAATAKAYLEGDDQSGSRRRQIVRELLLLRLAMENQAAASFRFLFDDTHLALDGDTGQVLDILDQALDSGPPCVPFNQPILQLLRTPLQAAPASLAAQLEYISATWGAVLPPALHQEILSVFDILREDLHQRQGGPGPLLVADYTPGTGVSGDYPEPERFSPDLEWMPNVVLMAKMIYVWLDQMSTTHGRPITRLDEIPDTELDRLAAWGFTGLWLIGIWERSPASAHIKRLSGNSEAIASAYSLFDYVIAADLGGQDALDNLRHRASLRGIRLASDMVPNHTGIDSRWVREHPDWFIQRDMPPYPAYRFDGPDLSATEQISLRIEDGYWSRSDAAVVFQHVDNQSGRIRYIYHGNDGTSTPWNDTAQLNYLLPEVREAVIQTILHVARSFPIIRFDAAMTLAKKHYQRLWFPQAGLGGAIPSRSECALSRARFDELFPEEFWREVVDRVAAEVPDTLLLAEAFWLMEGYFVRTLGMHRVYNSAFMNMLKMEENAKYRQTISNVLSCNPEILQRFVNFMNNPDERTAVEQFGREGKYFGAALLMVTMPGLPMFGHGQVEGFTEKYGMEYRRAAWNEPVDQHLVAAHERIIFPLMKKRWLFSGAEHFVLYDFTTAHGVDENVFAYSNACGTEKALIIFHNRFAVTSGRIHTSGVHLTRNTDAASPLMATTIAQELDCKTDDRYYYRFRDVITGMEYLRQGSDLWRTGLLVKLEAYQYHAFLDFQELVDDRCAPWGKLCDALSGSPVASLEAELKQIRFAGTHAAMTGLLQQLPAFIGTLLAPDAGKHELSTAASVFENSVLSLLETLRSEADQEFNQQRVLDTVLKSLTLLRSCCTARHRRTATQQTVSTLRAALTARDGRIGTLLVIFMLCREVSTAGTWEEPAGPLVVYGLDRSITATFAAQESAEVQYAGAEGVLLRVLLNHGEEFQHLFTKDPTGCLVALLNDRDAQTYLHVHCSNGSEWFNKERWEELSLTLTTCALLVDPVTLEKKASWADQVEALSAIHKDMLHRAVSARYRKDLLLKG